MTEETPINYLVKPETPFLNATPDEGGSYMWVWLLIIIIFGLCLLGGYYYILYFYDSLTLEDAIEKAIKHFNERNAEAQKEINTGDTGSIGSIDSSSSGCTDEAVLEKVLDNAVTEEFSNYSSSETSSNIQKLGQLNWCFIDDNTGCNALSSSDACMSGDIFPTRDICINPKLRTL